MYIPVYIYIAQCNLGYDFSFHLYTIIAQNIITNLEYYMIYFKYAIYM